MTTPLVSALIDTYNQAQFIEQALVSVLEQGLSPAELEVVVVDDGSTDERTRAETDRLIARGTMVIRQENRGLAAARNAAILASQGQYIFPLDADDHIRPGCLDHGVRILDTDPRVGVVYGDGEYFGIRTGRWRAGPFDPNQLMQWNYIAVVLSFATLFGNRIADMTAPCPCKDMRTGTFGWALLNMASNLRTCPKSSLIIGWLWNR